MSKLEDPAKGFTFDLDINVVRIPLQAIPNPETSTPDFYEYYLNPEEVVKVLDGDPTLSDKIYKAHDAGTATPEENRLWSLAEDRCVDCGAYCPGLGPVLRGGVLRGACDTH